MSNFWVLATLNAKSEDQAQEQVITAEPLRQETETIAVAAEPNSGAAGPGAKPKQSPHTWIFLALMFVVLYMVMFRGPRKKQQQHTKMLSSLQKNDKVQTIGGIIGTIIDIKDDEITLKVDESNNTKIKVLATAISRNISQIES